MFPRNHRWITRKSAKNDNMNRRDRKERVSVKDSLSSSSRSSTSSSTSSSSRRRTSSRSSSSS